MQSYLYLLLKLYKILESFPIQVLSKKEGFIPARPIEGTVVVNIGDLLQRWTNDKLVSTVSFQCLKEVPSCYLVKEK